MLKVYIAGASREIERVKRAAELLDVAFGVRITHRWWLAVEQHGVGNDGSLSEAEQRKYANADLDAVDLADVVLVLWPEARSLGMAVELGYAICLSKRIIVAGDSNACIFTALAQRVATDSEALALVLAERS